MIRQTTPNLAFLAPVPCIHFQSALEMIKRGSVVAFGTNKFPLDDVPPRTRVLFYISATGSETDPDARRLHVPPHQVTFEGVFVTYTSAKRDKHPNPEIRPPSAFSTDDAWANFYEVERIREIERPVFLRHLRWAGNKSKVEMPPRGPGIVFEQLPS